MNFHLGIDPGSTNLGWAILSEDRAQYASGTFSYKKYDVIGEGSLALWDIIRSNLPEGGAIVSAAIERYVPYDGKFNANSELTCEVIGSLTLLLHQNGIKYLKTRAIDWKIAVCKLLFLTERFTNPSTKLDKVFSVALAVHLLKSKVFKTDHEADAYGLAFYAMQSCNRGYYEARDTKTNTIRTKASKRTKRPVKSTTRIPKQVSPR